MLTILIAFMLTLFLTSLVALCDQVVELAINPAPVVKVLSVISFWSYENGLASVESLIERSLTATLGREGLVSALEQSIDQIVVSRLSSQLATTNQTSREVKPKAVASPVVVVTPKKPTYYLSNMFDSNDQISFSY